MNTTGNINSPTINLSPEMEAHLKAEETRLKSDALSHVIEFGGYVMNDEAGIYNREPLWVSQQYGFIKFQKGPISEGVNGVRIAEDVIPALIKHLQDLNAVLPSRETSLAITKMEEANMWLLERKRQRLLAGALDTYRSH